jgi:cell division protein FtsZ
LLVDTLIVIPNQKLLQVADQHLSMIAAFGMINNILSQSVRSISDIITRPGHINVDYADVRAIMKDRGLAVMGTGKASGPDRAYAAALQAISSPLLENMNIEGAHGVLLNITGGKNLSLHELSQAASVVYQAAHEDANIILGSVIDENLGDEVHVTIIATGFDQPNKEIVQSKELMDKEDINKSLIYDQHDKKELHLQAAQKVEQVPVIVKAEQEKQDSYKEIAEQSLFQAHDTLHNNDELDLNDLDIPTFLREKQEKEQQF